MYSVLNENIQFIKGIGPKKAEKLELLGIKTIKDSLYYFPRQFEDRSKIKKIIQLEDGEKITVKGVIKKIGYFAKSKKVRIVTVEIKDETGSLKLIFFNKDYIRNSYRVGDIINVFGIVKVNKNGLKEMQNCEIEYVDNKKKKTGIMVPVYSLTAGITNKDIQGIVRTIFDDKNIFIREYMPKWIVDKYRLCDINYAIRNIHFPKSKEALKVAIYRIIFEELLILQLGLFLYKGGKQDKKGIVFKKESFLCKGENCVDLKKIEGELPFSLTKAQKKALDDILFDMESDKVMNRLVQGDVGSGKTVVAQIALANSVLNGYQGAYMAPTEILAKQHYMSFKKLFDKYNIKIASLTGSTKKNDAKEILQKLKEGQIDIIIGTHALLEDRVEFNNLGLVITDEQHRFGVRQRAKLSNKGKSADIIVMTATPIPRTLALILYGDLDISVINELPPGRKPIETIAVQKKKREYMYKNFIDKELKNGRQVYVVCPLVEESEKLDVISVEQLFEEMKYKFFENVEIGLLHGKMKPKEKDEVMRRFKNNEIKILVSTTVIEVGVDVSNATLMVIENAERFGLAQLHQLRGRVGRGEYQSTCILIYDSNTEVCKKRMQIMQENNDGFIISEKDLEIRGPGEFFGTRQHGIPELKLANLFKHGKILKDAQKEARFIYSSDVELKKVENKELKKIIDETFKDQLREISLN